MEFPQEYVNAVLRCFSAENRKSGDSNIDSTAFLGLLVKKISTFLYLDLFFDSHGCTFLWKFPWQIIETAEVFLVYTFTVPNNKILIFSYALILLRISTFFHVWDKSTFSG